MGFQIGIVEGFYGRQWSWQQRFFLPSLMREWGQGTYIYAPKGDASLRSRWRDAFSASQRENFHKLGNAFQEQGLEWGLGLSPAGLQAEILPADWSCLDRKLDAISDLSPDVLWLLFDDLPAGTPGLADNQIKVALRVRNALPEVRLAVCPSYYSFDPILETLFGARPAGYFDALNAGLPEEVDLLWTGNKVVSETISAADVDAAAAVLGRAPLLWDNYPVNDGRKTSRYLNLAPFSGREATLREHCRGHFANPMNQFWLNTLPLSTQVATLSPRSGKTNGQASVSAPDDWPAALRELLARDEGRFQQRGLDQLSDADKQAMLEEYQRIDHPAAVEVCEWLLEDYRFDPNCLTD